jgi:hypothetical protein
MEESKDSVILLATYKCRACGESFQKTKKLPHNRTASEVVAESTMNRPNPLIHPLCFHECVPYRHGIGELSFIDVSKEQ